MLPYESISDALLDSAEQVGLNIWQSEEHLDPQTLTRTFTLKCLTPSEARLRPSSIQATLAFKWDAAMTVISTLGTEAICEKYHSEDVGCPHALMGCAYEATLALELTYTIPLHIVVDEDIYILKRLERLVKELHRSIIDHGNVVAVDANVRLDNGTLQITHLEARQRWTIGNPLHDLDELQDTFEEACSEARDMILLLADRFAYAGNVDPEEQVSLSFDDGGEDRVYLRPSTA